MITYEQRLNANFDWALQEGSKHFENASAVHKTLRKIVRRLDEFGIPYAVVGSMAMFFHGYRRFTEDVDSLVTREGLAAFHGNLVGLEYVVPSEGSTQLRDAEFGVKIQFLVTGEFPGDGRPKPISFPDPAEAAIEINGLRCLQLARLIELKLAAGIANPKWLKHLGDAQQMIDKLGLPETMAEQMHPLVRHKYMELWTAVRDNPAEP